MEGRKSEGIHEKRRDEDMSIRHDLGRTGRRDRRNGKEKEQEQGRGLRLLCLLLLLGDTLLLALDMVRAFGLAVLSV